MRKLVALVLILFALPASAATWNMNGIMFNAGPMSLSGNGPPSTGLASNIVPQDGDSYTDATAKAFYSYSGACSCWSAPTSLIGPQGPQGPVGPGGGGPATVYEYHINTPVTAGTSWVTVVSKAVPALPTGANGWRMAASGVLSMTVGGQAPGLRWMRDSTPICIGAAAGSRPQWSSGMNGVYNWTFDGFNTQCIDQPGDTSAHIYTLQLISQNGSSTAVVGERGDDTDGAAYARFPTSLNIEAVNVQ